MGCPIELVPGFTYNFQPACDEILVGRLAFSLLDPNGFDLQMDCVSTSCPGGLVPGQPASTQYIYSFTVPCQYTSNSWTLLRGCTSADACKGTPQITEAPGYSCLSPPPLPAAGR